MFKQPSPTTDISTDVLRESGTNVKDLECPILHEIMIDPVIAADGHSYERSAIQKWFLKSIKSPNTGLALSNKVLIPNIALRSICDDYRKARGLPTELPAPAPLATPATVATPAPALGPFIPPALGPLIPMAVNARARAEAAPRQSIAEATRLYPFGGPTPNRVRAMAEAAPNQTQTQAQVPYELRVEISVYPFPPNDPTIRLPRTPYVLDHCDKEIKRFTSLAEAITFIADPLAGPLKKIYVKYPHFDNAGIAEFLDFVATTCGATLDGLSVTGSLAVTEIIVPSFPKLQTLTLDGYYNLQNFSIANMPELLQIGMQNCGAVALNANETYFYDYFPDISRNRVPIGAFTHARIGTLKFNAADIYAKCPKMHTIDIHNAGVDPVCLTQAYEQQSARLRSLPSPRHRGA